MDLLRALSETATPPEESDGWYTVKELRRLLGMSQNKVYARLGELEEDDRLEHTTILRRNLAGRLQPVPGYRLRESETPAG